MDMHGLVTLEVLCAGNTLLGWLEFKQVQAEVVLGCFVPVVTLVKYLGGLGVYCFGPPWWNEESLSTVNERGDALGE